MIQSKLRKVGKSNSSKLKARADKYFSRYIRLRDMIPGTTLFRCISCGKIYTISKADCGHYINRSHMATRYSEINCNAQCRFCNRFDEGNMSGYRIGLMKKHGKRAVMLLESMKNQTNKISEFEYEAMIQHYKERISQILKERRLTINVLQSRC